MFSKGFTSKLTGCVLLLPGGATWQTLMLSMLVYLPSNTLTFVPTAPDTTANIVEMTMSSEQSITCAMMSAISDTSAIR